ncbi:TraR/DksA C4-type zinc finger protein [Shewanella khirikhana]|uniref:Prokaryotic dksA/traR C4-type zinc finger n=1 Tax=Shewanella khirikhana TaxID=1965282 RepID=A0ABM7D157_9GAMM|nr:TraR/DksA C4-type zinc finger protein [Shewanella khirikhana]AZQ10146.1 Prokaryotic dksA/traR C4-type zinc finger [Shewanella khirikhana]
MTELFEQAQEAEQKFREQAIARQRQRETEAPDEDDEGNRYCLGCGELVVQLRLAACPDAVRCVECQSAKERR